MEQDYKLKPSSSSSTIKRDNGDEVGFRTQSPEEIKALNDVLFKSSTTQLLESMQSRV